MIWRILIFLGINFAALGIGSFFTGKGVSSVWYDTLHKAPWTPPGWVFGFAWTTIMICFAIYMAMAWEKVSDRSLLIALFIIQWILNVSWNPVFFHFQNILLGLVVISLLTIVVGYLLFKYKNELQAYSYLILPYFLWLLVATSLNGYIQFNN